MCYCLFSCTCSTEEKSKRTAVILFPWTDRIIFRVSCCFERSQPHRNIIDVRAAFHTSHILINCFETMINYRLRLHHQCYCDWLILLCLQAFVLEDVLTTGWQWMKRHPVFTLCVIRSVTRILFPGLYRKAEMIQSLLDPVHLLDPAVKPTYTAWPGFPPKAPSSLHLTAGHGHTAAMTSFVTYSLLHYSLLDVHWM